MRLRILVAALAIAPGALHAQKAGPTVPAKVEAPAVSTSAADRVKTLDEAKAVIRVMEDQQARTNAALAAAQMDLNREQIEREQEKLRPLMDARQNAIRQLSEMNPGMHWDETTRTMVRDAPPQPSTPITPPADSAKAVEPKK